MQKKMIDSDELERLQKLDESRKKQLTRQNEYLKNNYKRCTVTMKLDIYEDIKTYVLDNGISVNNYINTLIADDLEKRKSGLPENTDNLPFNFD